MHIPLSTFSLSLLILAARRERLLESVRFVGDRVTMRFSSRVETYAPWVDVTDEEARHLLAALLEAHYSHVLDRAQPGATC